LNLNSLAVTVIFVVVAVVAPDAEPATIAEPAIPSAAHDARLALMSATRRRRCIVSISFWWRASLGRGTDGSQSGASAFRTPLVGA
jgi:hypothetical protein